MLILKHVVNNLVIDFAVTEFLLQSAHLKGNPQPVDATVSLANSAGTLDSRRTSHRSQADDLILEH